MKRKKDSSGTVFLSYAREDLAIAEMLYADLTRAGVKLWFDIINLIPGQRWKSEIDKAMQASSHFLLLISKHSLGKRGHVQKELRQALDLVQEFPDPATSLIPVFIDRCQFFHPDLDKFHRVELYRSYENGLHQILRSLPSTRPAKQAPLTIHSSSRPLWQTHLEEAGWGVIFADGCNPEVKEALKPLIEYRREVASWRSEELFRVFDGDQAAKPLDTRKTFLQRCGVGPGSPVVRKIPYYLLIVGGPRANFLLLPVTNVSPTRSWSALV